MDIDSDVSQTNKKNEDEKGSVLLLTASFYYILFFVIFGLPVWYLTTTTYRANLPYDQIDKIFNSLQTEKFQIDLEIIVCLDNDYKLALNSLNEKFLNLLNSGQSKFEFRSRIRKAMKQELVETSESNSLEELDLKLKFNTTLNTIRIFVLNENISSKLGINNNGKDFIFLDSLYLSVNELNEDKLGHYILNDYFRLNKIIENYSTKLDSQRKIMANVRSELSFDTEYEITFSLIDEKPTTNGNGVVNELSANIDASIQKYFQHLLKPFNNWVKFAIKTQILLYSDFSPNINNKQDGEYFLRSSTDLSIMTNHIENRLGSRISDSSALQFVTYVPARQPLFLTDDKNPPFKSKTNAFLVPRWGGIYIYNSLPSRNHSVEADNAVKTFMTQFLDLIGIRLNKNSKNFPHSRVYSSEIYVYLLEKTLENQLNSINTLKSLSLLLNKINSMVIEDRIGEHVKEAVVSLEKSVDFLRNGLLEQAFDQSKIAFTNSEKAFFDKSLLEKLYFPEDQRFAIYIPLFIPVGIPLLLSTKYFINWYQKKKQQQKIA